MQPDIHFRPATRADIPTLMDFLQLIATFDGHPESFVADADSLAFHMFGPTPRSHAILVMKDDTPIGFATYYFTFSTFLGKPGLWLDDLYILEDERGHGTGTALLNHLADVARQAGCARIDWIVNQSNSKGIAFYQRIGAAVMDDYRLCRLDEAAIDGMLG